MKKSRLGVAVVLLALVVIVQWVFFPSAGPRQFKNSVAYKVLWVVDGDTVEIDKDGRRTTVRLKGVDTPELGRLRIPPERYGPEASIFLMNLLKGESVYVELEPGGPELDDYGRLLAYLYRAPDGLFVNLEIIRQGYGRVYIREHVRYADLFRDSERGAKEAGKGLWARPREIDKERFPGPDGKPIPQAEVKFVASRRRERFHKVSCEWAGKISHANAVYYRSRQDAIDDGKQPCRACHP